nr:immunoglobulin light chain junction region [Macaca mulatta]MOX24203.1 immunoglobulin light chain junction region [Macaca mulatta]MOX24433.1 immunoglobulin light chain junction region [Macaca mulatta]MOX24664.1 immunoglobulin light chain junction region [Macaca mulatta]MOX25112.1 immunoglobulin light chain junction region [Macaca mulatta]
CLQYSIYPPTF